MFHRRCFFFSYRQDLKQQLSEYSPQINQSVQEGGESQLEGVWVRLCQRVFERVRGKHWERKSQSGTRKGGSLDQVIEYKPPRGCHQLRTGSAIWPWCQRAAQDPVPCWRWSYSWDAAWRPASARTTRNPSCSRESVLWCATRTPLRTERSPPHLAYLSAPPGQRWHFPPCVEPIMNRQRWATRPWPSTLTRSDVLWLKVIETLRFLSNCFHRINYIHHTSHLLAVGVHK